MVEEKDEKDEKDDAPETPPEPKAKPKKRRSKLLLIGVPAFVLLMGGGAGAWWYFNQTAAAGEEAAPVEAEPTGMISLSGFIANLADPGGRKYLRASIVILVADEAAAKHVEENKLTMSRLKAAILEVLSVRMAADLVTPAGKDTLKKAIAEAVQHIAHLEARDVLFEEFIVQ